jgi:hypothetical protein
MSFFIHSPKKRGTALVFAKAVARHESVLNGAEMKMCLNCCRRD